MTLIKVSRAVYVLLGIFYVLLGVGSMLLPAGWLPQRITDRVLPVEIPNTYFGHLLQEFGTLALALGFVFLWYAARKETSLTFQWAITAYFFFDAVIHWFEPDGFQGSWSRGIVNSIPFLVMLLLGIAQLRAANRAKQRGAA